MSDEAGFFPLSKIRAERSDRRAGAQPGRIVLHHIAGGHRRRRAQAEPDDERLIGGFSPWARSSSPTSSRPTPTTQSIMQWDGMGHVRMVTSS